MEHSESIKGLAAALAKAQGEMENAHKTSANPFFRSKYADLAEIINTARPVLAKYGLSVVQVPSLDGDTVSVETVLLHESGEWLSGVTGSPMAKQYEKGGKELPPSPQAVGSSITYLRRYSLAAFCAMAQEDDDAEAASAPARTASNGKAPAQLGGLKCPTCSGPMWDNRAKKESGEFKPKSPDASCKDKACKGAIWKLDEAEADEAADRKAIVRMMQAYAERLDAANAPEAYAEWMKSTAVEVEDGTVHYEADGVVKGIKGAVDWLKKNEPTRAEKLTTAAATGSEPPALDL